MVDFRLLDIVITESTVFADFCMTKNSLLHNIFMSLLCLRLVSLLVTLYCALFTNRQVFVRKKDRITIQEKQRQVLKERELELEAKKIAEERKQQARRVSTVACSFHRCPFIGARFSSNRPKLNSELAHAQTGRLFASRSFIVYRPYKCTLLKSREVTACGWTIAWFARNEPFIVSKF